MNSYKRKGLALLLLQAITLIPLHSSVAQEDNPSTDMSPASIETNFEVAEQHWSTPVSEQLEDKDPREKADIKAEQLSKVKIKEPFTSKDGKLTVSIMDINTIDQGIEVFIKAWREGEPVGFGQDGSVEIEKIKIINPPIFIREKGYLKEDLKAALKESILHTVQVIAKDGHKIQAGKVGRTTTTIYTTTGGGTAGIDGYAQRNFGFAESWSSIRNGATGSTAGYTNAQSLFYRLTTHNTTNNWLAMQRAYFYFPTESIPDSDILQSATLSLHASTKSDDLNPTEEQGMLHIVDVDPEFTNTISTSNYDDVGSTSFGSTTYSNFSTSTYTNIALNSNGLTNINKLGKSLFATRSGADLNNDEPTWSSSKSTYIQGYFADQSGTTYDPKLIITHGPEETSVKIYAEPNDGFSTNSYCNESGTWSVARNSSTTSTHSVCDSQNVIKVRSDAEDGSYQIYRGSLVFDTSILPDTATITVATLNLFGTDVGGENTSGIVLTSHNRASTTLLSGNDWNIANYGTTSLGSTTNPLNSSAYNTLNLSHGGKLYIDHTTSTILGILSIYDFDDNDPSTTKREATFNSANASGTSTDPYIEITYTN